MYLNVVYTAFFFFFGCEVACTVWFCHSTMIFTSVIMHSMLIYLFLIFHFVIIDIIYKTL